MKTITLAAALYALGLTFFIIWTNPRRLSNIAFGVILLILTTWLACVYRTIIIGELPPLHQKDAELEWWLRANAITIGFLPSAIWLLQLSIIHSSAAHHLILNRCIPAFLLSTVSMILCLTPKFIYLGSDGLFHRGVPYYAFATIGISVYLACVATTVVQMRRQMGIKKVELQFLALNTGGFALILLGLNALGNYLQNRIYNRISVPLVLVAPSLTACALLFHRVFNAKEMFFRLIRPLWFIILISGGIYLSWRLTLGIIAEPFGLLLSIAVTSPIAIWIDKKSRKILGSTDEDKLTDLRRSIIALAQNETSTGDIINKLKAFIAYRFQTQSVHFLFKFGEAYSDGPVKISLNTPAFQYICEIGWATPESLERRRPSPGLNALSAFLANNGIGIIAIGPVGSSEPSIMIALTTRIGQHPYTFPEVKRIQNLGELIDGIVSRSHAAAQVAIRARMEFLSLMSRGLAHDLKNITTPISTYLSHENALHPSDENTPHLHSAAKNAMRAVNSYIQEILSFSKTFVLNVSPIDVDIMCQNVVKLASARAAKRGVEIATDNTKQIILLGDNALIERMLLNIVFNAIDASTSDQIVILAVRQDVNRIRFEVRDNGSGISSINMPRIFDPYFTTKNFGSESRGLGLGLAISNEIALLHGGTINVRSRQNRETVVIIDMPINPTH